MQLNRAYGETASVGRP